MMACPNIASVPGVLLAKTLACSILSWGDKVFGAEKMALAAGVGALPVLLADGLRIWPKRPDQSKFYLQTNARILS